MMLTTRQRHTLTDLLKDVELPCDRNQDRLYLTLENHGLIHPTLDGQWGLTDQGRKTAHDLLKRN